MTEPGRWRRWVISTVMMWALLNLALPLANTLVGGWPLPARLALVVPVVGATATWLVRPAAMRLLRT